MVRPAISKQTPIKRAVQSPVNEFSMGIVQTLSLSFTAQWWGYKVRFMWQHGWAAILTVQAFHILHVHGCSIYLSSPFHSDRSFLKLHIFATKSIIEEDTHASAHWWQHCFERCCHLELTFRQLNCSFVTLLQRSNAYVYQQISGNTG